MLEAMALGVACVATDCASGPRELSRDGEFARLVPPADREAMAVALQSLMSDAGARERLGCKASDMVRKEYALPLILDRWDHVIETVCQ
jgi:glycosyltransferase involved in cell wall biosynthesis